MSERARFYLEQGARELQKWRTRGYFDDSELAAISRRRTGYEHRIASQAAEPADFVAFAHYEQCLDRLLRKRSKRKVKGTKLTPADNRRAVLFILERATKKYPANLSLWKRLVETATELDAEHIATPALVAMLRYNLTSPEVWVYAAKHKAETNNAWQEARAVLQHGLRFNRSSQYLWIEYMRLELIYIEKILARRELLGKIEAKRLELKEMEARDLQFAAALQTQIEADAEELANLPDVDIDPGKDIQENPALRGDIALLVFDSALQNIARNDWLHFAKQALAVCGDFRRLDRGRLAAHVVAALPPGDEKTALRLTLPIRYLDVLSPDYPVGLRAVGAEYAKIKEPSLALKKLLREYLRSVYSATLDGTALGKAFNVLISLLE